MMVKFVAKSLACPKLVWERLAALLVLGSRRSFREEENSLGLVGLLSSTVLSYFSQQFSNSLRIYHIKQGFGHC